MGELRRYFADAVGPLGPECDVEMTEDPQGILVYYDDVLSRTCASCKHWERDGLTARGECSELYRDGIEIEYDTKGYGRSGYGPTLMMRADFGCNRWEQR